jgi:hypothetical protein
MLETIKLSTNVTTDGKLHLGDVACHAPPGPVEVVLLVQPQSASASDVDFGSLYGIAADLWAGEDAQAYVDRLRDEWER